MKNEKIYSINHLPKAINIIIMLFPLAGLILIPMHLDNDFYFLYSMGEYIANNGFPINDILSMHSEMKLVVQQWLCDLLYYNIYELAGTIGMLVFVALSYILFVSLFYKLCKLVTDNFFVSIITTTIVGLCMSVTYFTTRPQIITFIVFVMLFYALESYIKTKKAYWLTILPLLSLFLINWHASMWWLLFVFMLPYLVEAVPIHFKKLNQTPCCNIFMLLATMLVMFGVGFINPYGVDAVTYLFGSYGVKEINETIQEMQPTSFAQANGKVFLLFLLVFVLIFAFKKDKKINMRFFCLTIGTIILALLNIKGISYFLICGFFSMAYFLKDFDYQIKFASSKRTKKEKVRLVALVCIFCATICLLAIVLSGDEQKVDEKANKMDNLNEIVEVLDEKPKNEVVLYTGFNTGQYLEFNGYKPYIDGRAEVFLKKNNGTFDYFKEYTNIVNGKIYYKDFVDKYGFTYLIVDSSTSVLKESLRHDDEYRILCENDDYTLFELIR